jgi:hypothetical protein
MLIYRVVAGSQWRFSTREGLDRNEGEPVQVPVFLRFNLYNTLRNVQRVDWI